MSRKIKFTTWKRKVYAIARSEGITIRFTKQDLKEQYDIGLSAKSFVQRYLQQEMQKIESEY